MTEISHYRFPTSVWRHYEQLDTFPERFLVVGGAISSLTRCTVKGVSWAALQACQLHWDRVQDSRLLVTATWMNRYVIETARLRLRPMQSADVGPIHQVSNQPGVRKYLFDDKPVAVDFVREIFQQSASSFASRNFGIWTIREKRAPEIVGFCGLRSVEDLSETEILYALSETKWHFGYAIEAASAVQRYAFDQVRLDRLIGVTDSANVESWRVLERLGMCEYHPLNVAKNKRYAIVTRGCPSGS